MRTFAIGVLACTALVTSAALASVLDQHNEGPLLGGTSVGVIGTQLEQSAAQTLVCGISGRLDRVEMYINASGSLSSPLVLEVRPVSNGAPDAAVLLATQQVSPLPTGLQWVSFDISGANVPITASEPLALVLRSTQELSQGEYDAEGSADVYPGGMGFYRSFSGPWIPLPGYDLMFRTFVTPGGGGCVPDIDGNGVVNVNDFLAYLSLYAAGDARADLNQSGSVDVSDFLAYLAAYAAGC
jgi:hypothetical protein